jgi:hypothetical protein
VYSRKGAGVFRKKGREKQYPFVQSFNYKALRKGPHEVETKELFLSFHPFFQVGVHSDAPF